MIPAKSTRPLLIFRICDAAGGSMRVRTLSSSAASESPPATTDSGAVFDAADADGDGKLDRSEFAALLGLIKPVAPTARELHESRALLGRAFPRDPPTH